MSTIFALSSGNPPCAIAVIRISGHEAAATLAALTHRALPPPRALVRRDLIDAEGRPLDAAMAVYFPGPASATGDDVVELHLHGGSAVVAAVLGALAGRAGLTQATPGAFTRRAFDNGKLNLVEVEALADLLTSHTRMHRAVALERGAPSAGARVAAWRDVIMAARAEIEGVLDFGEEDGVPAELGVAARAALDLLAAGLAAEIDGGIGAMRLRNGLVIAITGPVNAGKSSLLNALARRDIAIVAAEPGTTRDVVEAHLELGGVAVTVLDTAGLRESSDAIEREGMRRGRERAAAADLVIALGSDAVPGALRVVSKCDIGGLAGGGRDGVLHVSAQTGAGLAELEAMLTEWAGRMVSAGEAAVVSNQRQIDAVRHAHAAVVAALATSDTVIAADELKRAGAAFDDLLGITTPDAVLDAVFSRFCIGK